MKTKILLVSLLLSSSLSFAQWQTNGNTTSPTNFLGTLNNQSLLFKTNSQPRMKINRNMAYPIDGYNDYRRGYVLIGNKNSYLYNHLGAYSMLHIDGQDGQTQEAGYRPWMKTGITLTGNKDLSYYGLRKVGTGTDITETTITWSDNGGNNPPGPDDMAFRFTGSGNGSTTISSDLTSPNDLDGRNIARFTPTGEFGLGNTFGTNPVGTPSGLYVRPQSLLHMSLDKNSSVWLQITNQTGTGQTAYDGFRLGVESGTNASGYLRWQENTPFIVQTDWDNNAGGINAGERMRITSIGMPGVPHPANAPNNNITRVAISESGSSPITRPRSLLHLGYNTGLNSSPQGSDDGWRSWMDIGTFMSNGTDNMYVGLKRENGGYPSNDRTDAIINWGDNGGSDPLNGPDNLRFVFTSTTSSLIPPYPGSPAPNQNGLEVMRMVPSKSSTLTAPNFGMVGIGNFSPTGPNTSTADKVDAKLDIDGDLRIRQVTENTTLTHVLVVDPNDHNRVHWVDKSEFGGGAGNYCGTTSNPLFSDYEIPLNSHNFIFSDPSTNLEPYVNSVIIGRQCGYQPNAKLVVRRDLGVNNPFEVIGSKVVNSDLGSSTPFVAISTGVYALTDGNNRVNYGVKSIAKKAGTNVAGLFRVNDAYIAPYISVNNTGVQAMGFDGNINKGLEARSGGGLINYGIISSVFDTSGTNYGIYASATSQGGTATSWAGYFDGDVYFNGDVVGSQYGWVSDLMFKNNVDTIHNAISIINKLAPKSFFFDTTGYAQLNFSSHKQYGFIAQQVDTVLPELVSQEIFPAQYDSLGNQTSPAIPYKSLNYNAFIAILMSGIQQQNDSIMKLNKQTNQLDSILAAQAIINTQQDSTIASLKARLSHLENCLSNILPILCSINNSSITKNDSNVQRKLEHTLNIELSNDENIILQQNVPNPFREKTQIQFYIPNNVSKATIVFYSSRGKMIKEQEISSRGNGSINVYGYDLSKGIYTYSLIVDGKIVKTRKMLKQ